MSREGRPRRPPCCGEQEVGPKPTKKPSGPRLASGYWYTSVSDPALAGCFPAKLGLAKRGSPEVPGHTRVPDIPNPEVSLRPEYKCWKAFGVLSREHDQTLVASHTKWHRSLLRKAIISALAVYRTWNQVPKTACKVTTRPLISPAQTTYCKYPGSGTR